MKKEHWIILGVGAAAIYLYMNHKKKKAASEDEVVVVEEAEDESMASATGNSRLFPNKCATGKEAGCAKLCASSGGVMRNGYCVQGRSVRGGNIRRARTVVRRAF